MWSPLTLRKRSTCQQEPDQGGAGQGHDKDNDEDHDKDLGSSTRELHVQVQQETRLEIMHTPVQGECSLSTSRTSSRLSFMSGSQVMYLNTSFEIVVESTLEEHHHEEDPEFTTKENYHWTAQQEKVPPPTPQQRHPVYFGSGDFFLIVANQSRFWLNPW